MRTFVEFEAFVSMYTSVCCYYCPHSIFFLFWIPPCNLSLRSFSALADQEVADGIASGIATGVMSGMVSGLTSGIASSLPSGIETPDTMLNLRKGQGMESEQPRPLYQVRVGRIVKGCPGYCQWFPGMKSASG